MIKTVVSSVALALIFAIYMASFILISTYLCSALRHLLIAAHVLS